MGWQISLNTHARACTHTHTHTHTYALLIYSGTKIKDCCKLRTLTMVMNEVMTETSLVKMPANT